MKLRYNIFFAALMVSAVKAADINVFGTRTNLAPAAPTYAANNFCKPSFASANAGLDGGLGTNVYVVHDDANLDGDGNPATVTWTSNNAYFVRDKLFIPRGTTLTIQPGTTIYGSENENGTPTDKSDDAVGAITASRGGKLIADGTAALPIVFTSDRVWEMANTAVSPISPDANVGPLPTSADAGLWGGVVLLGQAYVSFVDAAGANTPTVQIEGFAPSGSLSADSDAIPDATQYGTSTNFPRNDSDNSGTIRYVSIQHGGYEFSSGREINGLTLGGVGRGTIIEFVEVYANQDDGIEFFGGTVNTRNLVMAFNQDDSFDIDESFNGTNQFWFSIQNPGSTDAGGEWDGVGGNGAGYNLGDALRNQSNPKIYNATIVGPGRTNTLSQLPITTGTVNWEKGNHAMLIEDRFAGEIYNSVFDDFAGDMIRWNDTTIPGSSIGINFKFRNNTVGRFGSVPIPQIETATLTMGNGTTPVPVAGGGTLVVNVTVGANAAVPVNVTVADGETIAQVAANIATAVLGVTGVTGNYTAATATLPPVFPATTVRHVITLVESPAGTQDGNLNINIGALASAGISAAASSGNTQNGAATSVTIGTNTTYLTSTFAAQANGGGANPVGPATPGSGVYDGIGAPIEGNTAGNTDPLFTTYTRNGSSFLTAINPVPQAGSPLLTGALQAGAPTAVNYRGAFGAANWAAGWTKLSQTSLLQGGAIADTDNDGITDALEGTSALTALGFSAGTNNVAPTNQFSSIYSATTIQDLSADDIVVQKSGNTATLNIPVESSVNLVPPFTGVGNAVLVIPNVPVDKQFYRFRVAP